MRDKSSHRELRHLLFSNIRNYLSCEGSLALEQARKALFHSGVYCDICQMKQFNVKKLFLTQACLHVLHYIYLYMSFLCCSQKRQDHFVGSKMMRETRVRLNETESLLFIVSNLSYLTQLEQYVVLVLPL